MKKPKLIGRFISFLTPNNKLLLFMKLTLILSCILSVSVSASTYSQNTRMNIDIENQPIREVLKTIENQSKFRFFYNDEFSDLNKTVTLALKDKTIDEILSVVLYKAELSYKVLESNFIVITPSSFYQEKKITGTIKDVNGVPLPGVNIVEKGTQNGTIADGQGNYAITVSGPDAILTFSFVGYLSKEVQVGNSTVLDMDLSEDILQLDEIVVVGYGTQTRADITGSISSVSKSRLSQIPVTNVMQAIEGSVAGVSITQTSSIPGSSPTALVRGVNSISANTNPFIVMDGIPFNGNYNDINTNDIESVDILKDASAVAIYGTRGANGVILITTKKGRTGKPTISYNGYGGFENIANVLEPLSPVEYVEKYRVYMIQRGEEQTNPVPNEYEMNNYNLGRTTDWIKEATQQGYIHDHNLSISGGTEDLKYYVSGEYLKQQGVVKGYQYHRASIRTNLDADITDYLSAGTFIFFTGNNYDGGRANLLNASAMSPYAYPYNSVDKYEIYPMFPELLFANPLLGLYTDRIDRNNNLNGNIYAELKPGFINGLKYRINAAYTYIPGRYSYYAGRDANNTIGTADARNTETKSWIVENILTYSKDLQKHHVDFTGLYSAQKQDYFAMSMNSTNFFNDQLSYNNLGAGSTVSGGSIPDPNNPGSNLSVTGSYGYSWALVSQMARINYSFDSRYLLTVTARRDGYSAFGANTDKYGVFPSVAIGWNVTNERFLQDVSFVNNLKLRISYGKAGNQGVGVNQTATTARSVRFPFNGVSTVGVLADIMGNTNLNWESTVGTNAGLDFAILKSRINGTIDVYKTKTEDLLLRRNIPRVTGYGSVWDNVGKMQNTGIEVTLNTRNISTGGFIWESIFNFAVNRNKLLDLYGDKKSDLGNRWFIGEPLRVIYDYEMVGIWQEDEDPTGWDASAKPGDLKFKDQITVDTDDDGTPDATDGQITADDKIILGSTLPKWIGGLTNTFHYKNLHLSTLIQIHQGALKNNPDYSYADEMGRRNTPADISYWTAENRNNSRPALAYTNSRGYGYPMDNSYVRIKDVTLSYTVPNTFLSKVKIESLAFYVSGRNLYTFTDWVGWDPENNYSTRGSGDWTNNYPFVRSVIFGANVSLR